MTMSKKSLLGKGSSKSTKSASAGSAKSSTASKLVAPKQGSHVQTASGGPRTLIGGTN